MTDHERGYEEGYLSALKAVVKLIKIANWKEDLITILENEIKEYEQE